MFNKYFASVSISDNGKSGQTVQALSTNTLESIVLDERSVLLAIRKLKPNLSSGPDGLPPLLFK